MENKTPLHIFTCNDVSNDRVGLSAWISVSFMKFIAAFDTVRKSAFGFAVAAAMICVSVTLSSQMTRVPCNLCNWAVDGCQ